MHENYINHTHAHTSKTHYYMNTLRYGHASTVKNKYIMYIQYAEYTENKHSHIQTHTHPHTHVSKQMPCTAVKRSEPTQANILEAPVLLLVRSSVKDQHCHLLDFQQESSFPQGKVALKSTKLWVLFEKLQTFNTDTCIQRAVWQIRPVKVPNLRVNV